MSDGVSIYEQDVAMDASDRAIVRRMIARQPDTALLAQMLGLAEPKQTTPAPLDLCEKHGIKRVKEASGRTRCQECRREWTRRYNARRGLA